MINSQKVSFEVVGNQTYTTSLAIADVFEKRHDNIISQIRGLPQDEFTALNFKVSDYKDSTGRILPAYNLTRDGFSLLVMGFTGERAYKWKVEFIKAFNKMETMIKDNKANQDSDTLTLLAKAMTTMLNQNATILELLKKQNEPFKLVDKPISRMHHKRLSNEEKFLAKVISVLQKEEGINKTELLQRVGKAKDDRTARKWLESYDGIYWRANLIDAGRYVYSYSLIEE
ncbi:Rha family transcriptional regulator [Campylobacter fetus]|uniref:Rha family transcriptional regulator n=1 Tax=Campylobacter fetus TaxID=196 RepID=UPI001F17BC83|nr:Rha family transcriptional regulator [Campylobacter fetus]